MNFMEVQPKKLGKQENEMKFRSHSKQPMVLNQNEHTKKERNRKKEESLTQYKL